MTNDLRYTRDHEWVRLQAGVGRIGITDHAQQQLGDVVFVELPKVGSAVTAGARFGTVESVKAVEELVAPITGTVQARNEAVLANPEELQNDPYGEGWLLVVVPSDLEQIDSLMDATTYQGKVDGH